MAIACFLALPWRIVVMSSQETDQPQTIDVTLLANHWKSKLEDTKENQYTLARRLEQAQFTASLMQELKEKRKDEYLVLAGDLNDVPGSEPLSILKTTGLRDLTLQIDRSSRYTLIFQGVSQVIDYLMELPLRGLGPAQIKAMHINADFPTVFTTIDDTVYRSSDHDPLWVNIIPLTEYVHFPQVYIGE
jgi:predicted extracellular nuclease